MLVATTSFGQMKFAHGDWDDVLARAKSQDKIIFVDAYAEWCGPCKMMAKNVFTDEAVGEFYNDKFLNVKIDMEKGEGPGLAQRYEVRAYPTFLFVDGDGNLVHRGIGSQPAEAFIELGKSALNPDKRVGSLDRRFKKGDRDPDFLYNYAKAKIDLMDGNYKPVVEAYLETQEDWTSEKTIELIFHSVEDVNTKMFDFFVDNKVSFENIFGKDNMINKVQQIAVKSAYVGEAAPDFKAVEDIMAKFYPEEAQKTSAQMKLNYYGNAGDKEKFAQAAVDYFNKYPSDNYQELNSMAWSFYLSVEDKKMLKQAIKWAKKSVELNEGYANMDTLAALYSKLGKKGKTKKYVNKAIELAKATGEDYSETQKLLESL
jgi:thiol-disulfide isomerase/thioredoxin